MKGARKKMRMLIVLCEWRNRYKRKMYDFYLFNIYYMMEEDVIGRESM